MPMTRGLEPVLTWFRRQGHRVVMSESAAWYDAAPRFFQAFPFHPAIDPDDGELRRVFRETRALGLRYSAPLSARQGRISYHVLCAKRPYGLDQVSRQTRQNVRKGLEHAVYGPVSFDRLAEEGWPLRRDTLVRQGRLKAENEAWWRKLCLSAEELPGFEAWGATRDGRLIAALVSVLVDGTVFMLYQQSLTEHLKHGVNNALGFEFTRNAVARPEVKRLFYGHQSLDAADAVDDFKFRMGYEAAPVRQCVVFHPLVRPVVRPAILAAVDLLGRLGDGQPRLLKAAGLMRFHLEGKRPLAEQACPECLAARRSEWLSPPK